MKKLEKICIKSYTQVFHSYLLALCGHLFTDVFLLYKKSLFKRFALAVLKLHVELILSSGECGIISV